MKLPQVPLLTIVTLFLTLGGLTSPAQSASDLMVKGDAHDATYNTDKALSFYLPAEKLEPENVELLLRIARQYRHAATDATALSEKLRLGAVALDYAKRAAALAPQDADAQLSVAISYGKLAPIQGNKERVESSRQIKIYVDKALKLDPKNDLAWHVLGKWNYVLADLKGLKRGVGTVLYGGLPTTTNADALKCYNHAIRLNPGRSRHYVELGRVYAQMGDEANARKYLEKGLRMPNTEKDDPEIKAKGKDTLDGLK